MNSRLKKIILLAGDLVLLYFALYLTLAVRYLSVPNEQIWLSHIYPFTIMFAGWILIFYISGLYDWPAKLGGPRFYRDTLRSLGIASVLAIAFFYALPTIGISPKRNLLIFIVIYGIIFILWRRIFNWLLSSQLPKINLAFVGLNGQVNELVSLLNNNPHFGYTVKFVAQGGGEPQNAEAAGGATYLNNVAMLSQSAKDHKISTLVFAANPHESDEIKNALFSCLPLNLKFQSLSNFYEELTGKVPLEGMSEMWFLENLNEGKRNWFDAFKRAYDILLAAVIFLATIIFWPIIALVIKLGSRGPVFIHMPRLGKGGKVFRMLKFRTMLEAGNDRSPTLPDDPRITRFGRFMRRTRIDEIPQVLNILKGEMSFVGPRPERPELATTLEKQIPFYRERTLVKPGATGWDQISGEYHSPSLEDSLEKLQYDLFYIKNRSLYLDLSIILKTIATVLSRKGL